MDVSYIYYWTLLVLGTGLSIKALETLSLRHEYAKRGIFDYEITGDDALAVRGPILLKGLYSKPGVLLLALFSLALFPVLVVVYPGTTTYRTVAACYILINVAVHFRHAFGLDGADQMALIILVTTLLCFVISGTAALGVVGVWFIAMQLSLSYLVSGLAKLLSPEWRSGVAIAGILSTYTYGTNATRKLVVRNGVLCRLACWAVMVVEVALPFGLLLSPTGVIAALTLALILHLSIAVIMGLNDFVWSFAAAFPAYYYVGVQV